MATLLPILAVVKLKAETKLDDPILLTTPVNYEVTFPQVSALSDKDISLVKEVLDLNCKKPDVLVYTRILNKTKEAIEKKIGVNSNLHPLTFLDTVLKDYNYLITN